VYLDCWSPGLRQGDIVGKISLPLLGAKFEVLAGAQSLVAPPPDQAPKRVVVETTETLVVVISHDCEFNERKRNKLLVARLQRTQGNLTPEQREALRASNDVEVRVLAELPVAGVDCWVFDPLPGIFDKERIASFTTITPLPMGMHDELLTSKKAELRHDERVKFRSKLAWFMGRDAEDIPPGEKTPAPDIGPLGDFGAAE
jgi:hypothetical protein